MTKTAVLAGAYLHHLAFESSKPARLAAFYGAAMDMVVTQLSQSDWRCEGPGRRLLVGLGTDKQMGYAGFACRDKAGLTALRLRAQQEDLDILDSPSPYFQSGAFALRDPNGQTLCFGVAQPAPPCLAGLPGPVQHLTFAATDVEAFVAFYQGKLGFSLTDRVVQDDGGLATAFVTSNHEHHTLACFKSDRNGMDHHSYEAGDWAYIRDWCDHFATQDIQLAWGPGRHGPGNNLFVFITDPDGNWIEVSAELEVIYDRGAVDWPHHPRTLNKWGCAMMRS